jgi:hypothetical protein
MMLLCLLQVLRKLQVWSSFERTGRSDLWSLLLHRADCRHSEIADDGLDQMTASDAKAQSLGSRMKIKLN